MVSELISGWTGSGRISSQTLAPPAAGSSQLAAPAAVPARGGLYPAYKAAREFEAQLIGSLLASLEKTFAAVPGDDSIPGSDDYNYLGTQALAEALADRGGFGIAAMIMRHLPEAPKADLRKPAPIPPDAAYTKVSSW
jgi:Rod binding domain-containing protein